MPYDDIYRFGTSQDLSVNSVGGAVVSTAKFSTETYAVQLNFPGSASSTGGMRVAIVSDNDPAVSSTAGTLLSANWPYIVKVTPGQRVSAISNDAGVPKLNITELSK